MANLLQNDQQSVRWQKNMAAKKCDNVRKRKRPGDRPGRFPTTCARAVRGEISEDHQRIETAC